MVLLVKTINGVQELKQPPNGGWGWVIVVATFFVVGLSYGLPKSLGVFFNAIRDDFGTSNALISWFLTFIMSLVTLSGLLAEFLRRWLDGRQIVICGGVLSCTGLVICSISPNVALLYLGGMLAGCGYGMSALVCVGQIALYFTTLTALANGIGLTGPTVLGVMLPYLNRHLLDQYGWRGSVLILGALSLNIATFGALIHPIYTTATRDKVEAAVNVVSAEKREETYALTFLKKYWLGFCFLLVVWLNAVTMYVPNVYIVPHALEINLSETQSTVLLSSISIGDCMSRLFTGFLASKSGFFQKRLLHMACFALWGTSLLQVFPVSSQALSALLVFCVAYGWMYGTCTTAAITAASKLAAAGKEATCLSLYFASNGAALLVSGLITGAVADHFGTFKAVFWLAMLVEGVSAFSATVLTAVARFKNNGNNIFGVRR